MRPVREKSRHTGAAYFVSTQTVGRKPFFRHEPWARLLMKTLAHYAEKDFTLHAYVIMPDHLHCLITPAESLEKSVQLIKGGFSFRAKREFEWKFDVWQSGFTDHRIRDEEDWSRHLNYIRSNPVGARLVEDSVLYQFMDFPSIAVPQGLKPRSIGDSDVRAEARTLRPNHPMTSAPARQHLSPPGNRISPASGPLVLPAPDTVKGTGFSPSDQASCRGGALAPEEEHP